MATPSGPLGMSESTGPRSACGVPALGRSARQATPRTTAVTRPKDARGCIARRIVSRFVAGRQFGLAAATFRLRHTSQSLAPRPPPIAGAVPVSAEVIHVPLAADVALRRERARGEEQHQRSEEHTSELQSLAYLVCRLLLEKKKSPLTVDCAITPGS